VSNQAIYLITTWAIPVIIAITFHEAAHGFVAHRLGDDTAWRLGRVSLNPVRHIDPFGTIVMPGLLLLLGAPFLFGYAKPVPVNFRALRQPRRDTILVAAAGPATNIGLALIAGAGFHIVGYLPDTAAEWLADNLRNALVLNVMLAVFNLFPLPPLDGGRILVALLPKPAAMAVARVEPFGLLILIALLIVLPLLGDQLGVDLNYVSHLAGRGHARHHPLHSCRHRQRQLRLSASAGFRLRSIRTAGPTAQLPALRIRTTRGPLMVQDIAEAEPQRPTPKA
jgi:Zn-dependent protease